MKTRTIVALLALAVGCQPGEGAPTAKQALFTSDDAASVDRAEALALERLTGPLMKGVDAYEVLQTKVDHLGMGHTRVQQYHGGVPVFGGQAIVHLAPDGRLVHFTDTFVRQIEVDATPAITAEQARGTVAVGEVVDVELVVLRQFGDFLTWKVEVADLGGETPAMPVVFIDAHTGEEVWRYDNLQTARDRRTHDANNGFNLPGTLIRNENSGASGDGPVDAAHDHAGISYDYFDQEQGRDSWDGNGATVSSTAHYSTNYDNAFWDGQNLVYGDGGFVFIPLSAALDIVAHEFTHAVTERTAGLIYAGESGGLNEATSDIMGAVVESYSIGWTVNGDTWLVGENAMQQAGSALRSMSDPPSDGVSIDHYSDYFNGIDVHFSSGIANKAFYLMESDAALDIQQAADIWFRALDTYMTPSTTFEEARGATEQAAEDLFGAGSPQQQAVSDAWNAVGVTAPLDYVQFDVVGPFDGAQDIELDFVFPTPAGATGIRFDLDGNNGDADLYVRHGSAPTQQTYDCASTSPDSTESCSLVPAQAGDYHVMVHAWSAFTDVTLTALSAGGNGPCAGTEVTGTLTVGDDIHIYSEGVPTSGDHHATLSGPANADFDLYFQFHNGTKWITAAQSISPTSEEEVNVNDPNNRPHRWGVHRFSGTGDYSLCLLAP